jgi:hypothetical protein
MVSTVLAYSRGNLTTACSTSGFSLPTDYVEVPEITETAKELWAQPPADDVAGNCTTGEVLDMRCWEAMDMDEYVKWWWGAFNGTCEGKAFAQCFYIAMTPFSNVDCSIFDLNSPCAGSVPEYNYFQDKWNGVRNYYVAVSHSALCNPFSGTDIGL